METLDDYQKKFFLEGNWYSLVDKKLLTNEGSNRIYEVMRIVEGKPLFLEDHLIRFQHSLSEIHLINRVDITLIEDVIYQLIEKNSLKSGNLRFEIIVKDSLFKTAVYEVPAKYPDEKLYNSGIELVSYVIERHNPHVKQSKVNEKVRKTIKQTFNQTNAYEILLVDSHGNITEGSRSNVFFIRDNALYSPPSKEILEGITRKKVLEIAFEKEIKVVHNPIPLKEASSFNACFITGTSPKILPAVSLNNITFDVANPILKVLMKQYNDLIMECISGSIQSSSI